MNQEKLAKLQAQVRIGGKVSRKKLLFQSLHEMLDFLQNTQPSF